MVYTSQRVRSILATSGQMTVEYVKPLRHMLCNIANKSALAHHTTFLIYSSIPLPILKTSYAHSIASTAFPSTSHFTYYLRQSHTDYSSKNLPNTRPICNAYFSSLGFTPCSPSSSRISPNSTPRAEIGVQICAAPTYISIYALVSSMRDCTEKFPDVASPVVMMRA